MTILRYESANYKNHAFRVHWRIGNFCNYDCSYCKPIFKNGGTDSFVPLELAKQVVDGIIEQLPDRDISFYFSGGEPTAHPNFLELIDYTNSKNCMSGLITNGSRSVSFHRQLAERLSNIITFTFHAESTKPQRFFENIAVYPKASSIILVPMNEDHWDTCVEVFEKLFNEGYTVFPKVMIKNFGLSKKATPHEYTPERQAYMNEINDMVSNSFRYERDVQDASDAVYSKARIVRKNPFVASSRFIDVYHDDGFVEALTPYQLMLQNKLDTVGMHCYGGVEHINITHAGRVFKASCHQDGIIGNIYKNARFKIPKQPTICTQHQCWCVDDLKITKQAIKIIPILPKAV